MEPPLAAAVSPPPPPDVQPPAPLPAGLILQNYHDMMTSHKIVRERHNQSVDWSTIDLRFGRTCVKSWPWALCLTATTGSIMFGLNTASLNTAGDHIASEYKWCGFEGLVDCSKSKWLKTLSTTSVFIGAAVGAYFSGTITKKFGCRKTMLGVLGIFIIGIISSVCANSFSALFLARVIVGLGVGVVSSLTPNYIAEMVPTNRRGMFGVMHQIILVSSQLLAMILGLAFQPIPEGGSSDPKRWVQPMRNKVWWRFMLGIAIVPVVLAGFYFGYVFRCETPKYYVDQGNHEDAELLLKRIHCKDDVSAEITDIVDQSRANAATNSGPAHTIGENNTGLLSMIRSNHGYGMSLFVGLSISIFQQITGINAFMASSTSLFKDVGMTAMTATYVSIAIVAVNVLCTVIPLFILDKVGRKLLLLIGAIGMAASTAPASICYLVQWNRPEASKAAQVLAIAGACLFMVFFAISVGPITWIYIVEVFPLPMKDKGTSLCIMSNWLSAILMVFLAGILPTKLSYAIFTVSSLLFIAFIVLFIRETAGRPLGSSPYTDH